MEPEADPLDLLKDPDIKRKMQASVERAMREAFTKVKLAETDQSRFLTVEQIQQEKASLMARMHRERLLYAESEKRTLDVIFGQLVPSWADREWGDISEKRRDEWAKILVPCPQCDSLRGISCHTTNGHLSTSMHVPRLQRAEQIYTERRERTMQEEADRTCPWCGLMCANAEELAIHEKECD